MYAKLNPLQTSLPTSGQLADGTWVSNYHLLPDAVLKAEGWKEASEVWTPCAENQVPAFDKAELLKDGTICISYKAVDVPPDPLAVVTAERDALLAEKESFIKAYSPTMLKTDMVNLFDNYIGKAEPIEKRP